MTNPIYRTTNQNDAKEHLIKTYGVYEREAAKAVEIAEVKDTYTITLVYSGRKIRVDADDTSRGTEFSIQMLD